MLQCRVLYKVEDIATYLIKYVKFWDDWEVDRYGNANLGLKMNLPDHRIKQKWRWRHLVPVESIHHPMLTLKAPNPTQQLRVKIKKFNEKVYAAQVECELCKGPYYTKDCPLKDEGKTLEEAYYTHVNADFLPSLSINIMTKHFYNSIIKDKGDHEGKNLAGTLIDIPIFVGNFSIISGFSITGDMDITSSVVLGMPFCKKFMSCQKITERFAQGDKCERMDEE
ncbi:hypothetical protein Tco_1405557 [Tanacetum coccineum]